MTPSGGDRGRDARERARARREAIGKAQRRRRRLTYGLGGVVALVVAAVLVFVLVDVSDTKSGGADITTAATAAIVSDVTEIPASAYDAVGVSTVGASVLGLSSIRGGTPVTTGGLPTFVYVGGEFCPFCAAERWAVVAALSRFGTFTGLDTTRSAATDGNYATLSFLDAAFSSPYVAFSGTEQADRAGAFLKNPPAAELASFDTYGKERGKLSYPFVSIDNRYLGHVQYADTDLAAMSAAQIAALVRDPATTLGRDVLTSANVLSAGVCAVDGQKPAAVCASPAVVAGLGDLDEPVSDTASTAG